MRNSSVLPGARRGRGNVNSRIMPTLFDPFTDIADGARAPKANAGGSLPGPNVLQFDMQSQEQTKWCWAAVASSVCAYYAERGEGSAKSQCEIATQFLGMQCCITPLPPASANWPGNQDFTLKVPLETLNHFEPPVLGPLNIAGIAAEIDSGRPICCHIDWANSPGHFVVIIGYDSAHNEIIVRDPAGMIINGTLPLKGGGTFPGGTWNESYRTT